MLILIFPSLQSFHHTLVVAQIFPAAFQVFAPSPWAFGSCSRGVRGGGGGRASLLVPASRGHAGRLPEPLRHHAAEGGLDVRGAGDGMAALPPQPVGLLRNLLVDVVQEAHHQPLGLAGEELAASLDLAERLGAEGLEGAFGGRFLLRLRGLSLRLPAGLPGLGWRSPGMTLGPPPLLGLPPPLGLLSSPGGHHGSTLPCLDPSNLQLPQPTPF